VPLGGLEELGTFDVWDLDFLLDREPGAEPTVDGEGRARDEARFVHAALGGVGVRLPVEPLLDDLGAGPAGHTAFTRRLSRA
jgi:hypothetical protein